MLGGGDASNAARAAIQLGVPPAHAGPATQDPCWAPPPGGTHSAAVIPASGGPISAVGPAAPGSPAPGAMVRAIGSCTMSTTSSGSWAPIHPEGLSPAVDDSIAALAAAAGLTQQQDRLRLPPAPRWATSIEGKEQQQQQMRQLAAAKHAAAALLLPAGEAQPATPAGAAATVTPSTGSPTSPMRRAAAPFFSGASAPAAIATRSTLTTSSGGAAAAGRGQTSNSTEPALARELGVSMASLERLFRADAQFDYQQPVWMVVNLSGKIKGSYTAEKMVEFCRRGTLSARQLILGIDRDLPYTYRQDLGFYRPLGRLSAEVHAGGRYVPLSASRASGSNSVAWAPVVPAGSAAGDGAGAVAGGLSGLSLGGAAAADGALAAADATGAEIASTAATARSNSALRASLQRLFVPGGPANKRQLMFLYRNHLGWTRGPFSGGKLLHAHLCGRLPRDTLIVGYTPGVPVFMLSGDVPTWFRPLGALLDNVARGYIYNPISWKSFMEHSNHPGTASTNEPQQPWCPLVWPGPGEAPPLVSPEEVLLPPPSPAGQGGGRGAVAAPAAPWVAAAEGMVGLMAAGQQQLQLQHPPGLAPVAGLMQLQVSSGTQAQQLQPAMAMQPEAPAHLPVSSQQQQQLHVGLPSHVLLVASGGGAAAEAPGLCGYVAPAGFGVAGDATAAGHYGLAGATPQGGYAHAMLTSAGPQQCVPMQPQQLQQVPSQVLLQGPGEGLFAGAGVQQQQMFAAAPVCFPAGGQSTLQVGGVAAPAQLHYTAGMPAASAAALQLGGGGEGLSQWLGFAAAPQGL